MKNPYCDGAKPYPDCNKGCFCKHHTARVFTNTETFKYYCACCNSNSDTPLCPDCDSEKAFT